MPINRPTPFNMPPTFSNANTTKWLILGEDKFIIKLDRIIAAMCVKNSVEVYLDNDRSFRYLASTEDEAKQELKEIINILLQRNENEKS